MSHFLDLAFKTSVLDCCKVSHPEEAETEDTDGDCTLNTFLEEHKDDSLLIRYILYKSIKNIEQDYYDSVELVYTYARSHVDVPEHINISIPNVFKQCITDWIANPFTSLECDLNPPANVVTALQKARKNVVEQFTEFMVYSMQQTDNKDKQQ